MENHSLLSYAWRGTGLEARNLHRTVCPTDVKHLHCLQPLPQKRVTNRGWCRKCVRSPRHPSGWNTLSLKASTFFLMLWVWGFLTGIHRQACEAWKCVYTWCCDHSYNIHKWVCDLRKGPLLWRVDMVMLESTFQHSLVISPNLRW